jgi:hypothetical protein
MQVYSFFLQNLELLQLFYGNLGIEGWIILSKKGFSPATLGHRIE